MKDAICWAICNHCPFSDVERRKLYSTVETYRNSRLECRVHLNRIAGASKKNRTGREFCWPNGSEWRTCLKLHPTTFKTSPKVQISTLHPILTSRIEAIYLRSLQWDAIKCACLWRRTVDDTLHSCTTSPDRFVFWLLVVQHRNRES